MNKRKLLLVAVALMMVAILGFGGTLAYLTDTDHQVNTFTTGNVAIDLYEDFDNDEDGIEKLLLVRVLFEKDERMTGSLDLFADTIDCDCGKRFFCSNKNFHH